MRKSLWVTTLLILLSISLAVTGFIRVDRTGDQVEMKETVLFGDRTALSGLAVEHHIYDQVGGAYLYWDTAYRPEIEGSVRTEYFYTEKRREEIGESKERLTIDTYSGESVGSSGALDLMEHGGDTWGQLLTDVASRTEAGTTYEESVKLKEYCEFVPMYVEVIIGGFYYTRMGMTRGEMDSDENIKKLVDCFRIRTPEECLVTVEITKRPDGTVSDYSLHISDGMPSIQISSVVTEEYCYLLLGGKMADGSPLDTSEMIGGCGIYRLPYETTTLESKYGGTRETTTLYPDQMEQIAALDVSDGLEEFYYNEAAHRLEVIYMENLPEESSRAKLIMINAATGDVLQELMIAESSQSFWIRKVMRGDGFMVLSTEKAKEVGFILLEEKTDGDYQRQFEGIFPSSTEEDWITWTYGSYSFSVDYDGERLAFGTPVKDYHGSGANPCQFQLVVYEAGELRFHGLYANSLGIGSVDPYNGCMAWSNQPVEVRWE